MVEKRPERQSGYTLVELMVGIVLLTMIALSVFTLFSTLIRSTVVTKRKAVASTLAITQMETLRALPFNSLAVLGGPIYSTSYLPNTTTTTLNNVTYTIKTSIDYVDDAFDGCGSYPNLSLKQLYCRNYPPPTGAPATDTNPQDYKVAHVTVFGPGNVKLAEVDSQISARVAETASTTGALFVRVLDENGNPLSGATVQVANTTVSPNINLSDTSDSNGNAIFYGLPPDTSGFDYRVTGSLTNYSTLTTIAPSGSLTPTYPSQQILTQQSSFVTLTLKPQGTNSLVIETTDTNGNPLANMRVYVKGGYKKYTLTTNTEYYYDTMTPTDTRPTTDASGLAALTGLVPGTYVFCSETAGTNCRIGSTNYYVAAVLPYSGNNPFNPLIVPTYSASDPPATTFNYSGTEYLQKVRLMMTTSSSFPRIYSIVPDDVSLSTSTLNAFTFQVRGANLPCSSSAPSCATTVRFLQNSNTYTASCTGNSSGAQLNCTVNLTGITSDQVRMTVISGGNTLTTPAGTFLGGLIVAP